MQVRHRYNNGNSRNDFSMMHYGYIQDGLDPPLLVCMDRADGTLRVASCPDDDSDYGSENLPKRVEIHMCWSPAKPTLMNQLLEHSTAESHALLGVFVSIIMTVLNPWDFYMQHLAFLAFSHQVDTVCHQVYPS